MYRAFELFRYIHSRPLQNLHHSTMDCNTITGLFPLFLISFTVPADGFCVLKGEDNFKTLRRFAAICLYISYIPKLA